MPRAAVALASASESIGHAPGAPDAGLEAQLNALGRQIGHGRRFRPGRSQLLLLALAVVSVWLVLVFGRALTQLNAASDRHLAIASETQALDLRLAAGRRELALVQTDAFQGLQARGYGFGHAGEQVFSVTVGSSSAPLVTLASPRAADDPGTPLESWLNLLFGN